MALTNLTVVTLAITQTVRSDTHTICDAQLYIGLFTRSAAIKGCGMWFTWSGFTAPPLNYFRKCPG